MTAAVVVDRDEGIEFPDDESFRLWVNAALSGANCSAGASPEVSIRVCGIDEMSSLNHDFRGKSGPTNVLSFPTDFAAEVDCPLLGDLVICAPVVQREAREQGKQLRHHWAHMTVHGTLHLLGFDHIEDNEAEVMESLEVKILATLNIDNPYQDTPSPARVITP